MQKSVLLSRWKTLGLSLALAGLGGVFWTNYQANAQTGPATARTRAAASAAAPGSAAVSGISRPQYAIDAAIDYDLLTLKSSAQVTIPASGADPLRDAVFFLYANASGVGGDDARRKNLVVDSVSMNGAAVPWRLDGAVLRVGLPSPQSAPFALQIDYHGVVPRAPKEEGMGGLMGSAMSMDISGLLGMGGAEGEQKAPEKPKNTDYGLYTYGNGILSLGSFWYPNLAVRDNGKWADSAPEGLGDVAYSEKSDFYVRLRAPQNVALVAPGQISKAGGIYNVTATDAREFAVLMSEDFAQKTRVFAVGGKNVAVSATLLRKNAARLDQTLDIAGNALQIYSKRFGAYPYNEFKIVEAPMKGGAGGMEYSRVIGIASMLFGDMGAQLGGMVSSLNLPGADKLLESLGDDTTLAPGALAPGAAPKDGEEDGMGGATDMVGGLLGQQKEIFDSLLEETIAHEVAHQWWAIGVGSDSQKHPFVDESLTNWSSMLYFEDRYGAQKAEEMRDLHLRTSFSMGVMLGGGDKRADLPTSAYTNNMQYGAVIYGKGALYYDELRKLVGDAAFFGALRDYYARWNDRIAGPLTLQTMMQAKSPAKSAQIAALYRHWIQEAHGKDDIAGGMNMDLGGMLGNILGGGGLGGEE